MSTKPQHTSGYYLRKTLRIFAKVVVILLLLIVLLFILVQTPPVQNFARKKIENYLQDKLDTKVTIGKLYIGLPDIVSLQNIYIEDRQNDTLLAGGKLKVDIDLYKLLSNVVEINEVQLEDITAKIKRSLPDTTYNFQFIVDAFTPMNRKPVNTADSTVMQIDVNSILLNRVRVVYKDVVTGNDMDIRINHLTTTIDKFDPYKFIFDIPRTEVNGLTAKIYQSKPLVTSVDPASKDMAEAKKPIEMILGFKNVSLQAVDLDYRNDVSAFYTRLTIGALEVEANKFDLPNRIIELNKFHLNKSSTTIRIGNREEASKISKELAQELESQAANNWQVRVASMELNENNLKFDDDTKPRLGAGIDYAHLDAKALTLKADDFIFSGDSIGARITEGRMKEKSGFVLNRLEGNLMYSDKGATLQGLLIETPGTVVRRDLEITYPSLERVKKDPSLMKFNVDLRDTKIQVRDILVFAPQLANQPAFRNRSDVWYLNGRIRGNLANLQIESLQASGLLDTRIDIRGTLVGLTTPTNARGNLRINRFVTSRRDLAVFIPEAAFPKNITFPEVISITGNIAGNLQDINPNLVVNTNLGSAAINGRIRQVMKPENMQYDVNLKATNLDLGTIMQNPESIGKVTGTITANGRGIDPKFANSNFNGAIQSASINKYNYHNVKFNGSIANKELDLKASIQDPNIHLSLEGKGNFANQFPAVQFTATIDSLKAQPLNLSATPISYRGKLNGNFKNTDPDNLEGNLILTESLLTNYEQRFEMDSIELVAGSSDSGKFLRVESDVAFVQLAGDYKLTQLGSIFQNSIQPYFAVMPQYQAAQVAPYDFTITASILDKPLWRILVPGLTRMENVFLNGNFSNVRGWKVVGDAPAFVLNGNSFDDLHFDLGSDQQAIRLNATLNHLKGAGMNVYGVSVTGTAANNQADLSLNIKDRSSTDKYRVGLLIKQPVFGDYTFSIRQGDLLLNYDTWTVPADNMITIKGEDLKINNLILARNSQQLSINSTSTAPNSPVDVRFQQFKIGTISGFMQSDTLLFDGTINGSAQLRDLMKQPVFTTDLTVTDLSIRRDTIGNAVVKVDNTTPNTFAADVRITGRGNDLQLVGQYNVKENNNSTYDLDLLIRQLQLSTVEGATMNSIRNATGTLSGNIKFNGSLQEPNINGELNFNKAAMTVSFLNSYFTIGQEKIVVNNEGVRFNTFTVRDSSGNAIVIDGIAATSNFNNYRFDLNIDADNFRAINTTKKDSKLFYGQLYLNSNLHIGGTEVQPVVDGAITVLDKTDFTFVMPQKQPGIEEREGIVQFVDMDATMSDSVFLAPYDSINKSTLIGFDVAANIEIKKEAVLSMVIDEGNGDFIRMRGEALLTGGIDRSGNLTLTGSYVLEEGSYELSFNFIKRKFNIEKGSSIVWLGEPTNAELNISAYYVANTAPIDLVENQISEASNSIRNTYRQKLPFQVYLRLKGELLKPLISFDVVLPEGRSFNVSNDIITNVQTRLTQLRQEPSEINKQVFSLLLMNRFLPENPFDNNNGGGLNAETFARQSVSKLLTEQLNRLAGDLIQGVDINFDVLSYEDYTTGERRNRTDFNVSLSKQLLSERLTVKVGNNFELEGPRTSAQGNKPSALAGDVALDYKLSRDGRYMLRGYRKNEYQGVVEGYVIETGLSFIITLDYNHIRELFHRKKVQTIKREDKVANPPPSNEPNEPNEPGEPNDPNEFNEP